MRPSQEGTIRPREIDSFCPRCRRHLDSALLVATTVSRWPIHMDGWAEVASAIRRTILEFAKELKDLFGSTLVATHNCVRCRHLYNSYVTVRS